MFKKIFIIAACLLTTICASASDWLESVPGRYMAKNTQIIVSRESSCNQGEEAFMDFIPKFRTDKTFRDSRVRFEGENDEIMNLSFRMMSEDPSSFKILKASQKNTRCDKSYGTWYNVSADEVCFYYTDVLPCNDEFGGSSVMARFQRFDGKWYCTGLMIAG